MILTITLLLQNNLGSNIFDMGDCLILEFY